MPGFGTPRHLPGEPFVIPNPWDAGSARTLAALGFKALATTSSGFAFTLGRLDGRATLDEVVEHVDGPDPEPAAQGRHHC
jgi:2-methylisocitrate lyase-like PEP mutase family enzyme